MARTLLNRANKLFSLSLKYPQALLKYPQAIKVQRRLTPYAALSFPIYCRFGATPGLHLFPSQGRYLSHCRTSQVVGVQAN